MLTCPRRARGRRRAQAAAALDADGDGKVGEDEVVTGFARYFTVPSDRPK